MATHITSHRRGFELGKTAITTVSDLEHPTGIALGVLRLGAGEELQETPAGETAWLLMSGELELGLEDKPERLSRGSLFDEKPTCVHVPAGQRVRFSARTEVELTSYACANRRPFAPRLIRPEAVRDERRGEGCVGDAALRIVRTLFDRTNSDPAAELVLGEVVTLPGRWSSYPPHHHPQPEIYHYRFSPPQGFGHAELGDTVLKVRHNDTVKILEGVDHPQCAAPGYAMYYAWVIRHLPESPYTQPEFTGDHTWTMQPDADLWWPKGVKR